MTVRTLPGQQVGGMLFGRRVNIERNDQGKVEGFDTSDDCYEPLLVEWQSMPHRTVGVPYSEVEIVPPAAKRRQPGEPGKYTHGRYGREFFVEAGGLGLKTSLV